MASLEHHELLQLLDTIDDERSRSRFRESIYISVFVYLALAWFVFYGPRILFHQGRIVSPADVLKQRDKELTYLNMPEGFVEAAAAEVGEGDQRQEQCGADVPPNFGQEDAGTAAGYAKSGGGGASDSAAAYAAATATGSASAVLSRRRTSLLQPAPQPQVRQVQPQQAAIPDAPKPNFSDPAGSWAR